jgi:O-antigen/teichoic acid export membrane protein
MNLITVSHRGRVEDLLNQAPKDLITALYDLRPGSSILQYDKETHRILRHSVPSTLLAVSHSFLSNAIYAIVGHAVGTKQLAA